MLKSASVASLGWVTPGAATEGVTPSIFSWKTWRPFFAHRCHYHYRFLLLSLGCHPLQGITPHLFYLSDLVSPLFFVNLPTKCFTFGCHPLEGVTRGAPLVTPLERMIVHVPSFVGSKHRNVTDRQIHRGYITALELWATRTRCKKI